MSQQKQGGGQSRQSAHEPEQDATKQRSGNKELSTEAKSRTRASTGKGAGGGAKQKQKH